LQQEEGGACMAVAGISLLCTNGFLAERTDAKTYCKRFIGVVVTADKQKLGHIITFTHILLKHTCWNTQERNIALNKLLIWL